MPGPVRFNKKGKVVAGRDKGGGRVIRTRGRGKPTTVTPIRSGGSSGGSSGSSRRSSGGRTRAERSLQRNLRINRKRAKVNPLATKPAKDAIERLRTKYGISGRTKSQENLAENMAISRDRNQAERKLENTVLRSLPTRGEALKAERRVREGTRLNVEGTRVERLDGAKQVGTQPVEAIQRAAERGQLRRKGKQFTTPEVRRVKRKVKRASRRLRKAQGAMRNPRKSLMGAGLTPEQAKILSTVLTTGRKMGASKKEMLAAVETALVESNISNPTVATDHDSLGWRQERQMYYDNPTNVKASSRRFFQETAAQGRGAGMTAGQLAQAVQRSAFPEKYDQRKAEAAPLLRAFRSSGSASPEARQALAAAERQGQRVGRQAAKLGLDTRGLISPKEARQFGIKPPEQSNVPRKTMRAFKGMIAAAKQLEAWGLPYVWGGGHGTSKVGDPRQYGGLDCSSTVSHILQQGGVKMPTVVSGDFGRFTKPGPGAVTILYNPTHVLMKIGNKYFGTSGTNPGGGPGWLDKSLGDSEMASGKYNIGHIPGLGPKIAKQMNLDPDSYRDFPGMTVSGNTATVNNGTVSYTPTFSSQPIVEGNRQGGRKNQRQDVLDKLREVGFNVTASGIKRTGVAGGPAPSSKSSGSQGETLTSLKRKYKV